MKIRLNILIALGVLLASCSYSNQSKSTNSTNLQSEFPFKHIVDLTHEFDSNVPHWHGLPKMQTKTLYSHEKDGFLVNEYHLTGQWGTHVDPPVHFHAGGRTLSDIPVTDMILPLVVIDVHKQVLISPDYQLQLGDIEHWEAQYGRIPPHALVAMRTDWSDRWPDQDKVLNKDAKGISHIPGWSKETLQFFIEQRKIAAIAHETPDTDPGLTTSKDDYSLESYLLSQGLYQIEFLDRLADVPEYGAIVIATWPRLKMGSGFPARVIAMWR